MTGNNLSKIDKLTRRMALVDTHGNCSACAPHKGCNGRRSHDSHKTKTRK